MRTAVHLTCITLSLLAGALAQAANDRPQFDLGLSALGDDASGRSFDVNAILTPNARWSIAVGGGSSDAGSATGAASASVPSLHGTSFNGSVDLKLGQFGLKPGFSHWRDDDHFSSSTPQLSAYWKHGGLRTQLLLERPKFALDYQLRIATQTITRLYEFSGNGIGGGLDWYGTRWSSSISFMSYSYGNEVTRVRAILNTPNLQDFPRLTLLASSMATLTRGALKDRASAGLEYAFIRTSVHADLSSVTDAISDTRSASYGLGVGYVLNNRVSIDLSGGISHADGLDDTKYASLALNLHW
jgi:hypothetical protein